jgi:hypothetical protein
MAKSRILRKLGLAAAVVALSACASSGTGGGAGDAAAGGDAVAVTVNNDLVPPSTLTVWMVPETGARRRLGSLTPNATQTFNFSPGVRAMEHRLVAESTGGSDVTSNPFVLDAVSGLRWNVSSPNVSIQREP